jgi:hypothetical protein
LPDAQRKAKPFFLHTQNKREEQIPQEGFVPIEK